MPLKINLKSVLMYAIYALCAVTANCALKGVPLSLGLLFSMLLCGTNIIITPIIYILASIVNLNIVSSSLSIFEAVFLSAIVFLYRRTGKKIRFESVAYLVIAIAPYVLFAPWFGSTEFLTDNVYILKTVTACITLIFTYFCFRTVNAVMFRLQRCRLREDELICLGVVYSVCGAGLYTLAGENFYLCFSAFLIVSAVRLTRSPSALIFAIVAAIPASAVGLNLQPVTVFVIVSAVALIFARASRFAPGIITGCGFALYMYFTDRFQIPIPLIVLYAFLLFLACFIPTLPKTDKMENLKNRLLVREVLPQTTVERNKRVTGEKLYRISEVFREIECAFLALDENINDTALKDRMLRELMEKCCNVCERKKRCERTNVHLGFKKLIDAGSIKGKVNLIDLPSEMTANCAFPSDVLARLNSLLADYRRSMTEAENARSGRRMLAEQAHGVADVMKSCAVDLSRIHITSELSEKIQRELSARGITCPELYVEDESAGEVSAVMLGKINTNAVSEVISEVLNRKYVLKDKLDYDGEKSCLIFGAPPRLDAVFGVAYAIKNGEAVSGDTHSVIRINERSFLMALSDGMGSGVYARKVSETAISLIEAFYRAEMPEDTVLNTINKLLSFNRDERFTCIDIVAVNLETGRADFVKIGSPAGIIIREGEIKILESESLPLGILENLRPTVCTEALKNGDIIVFMSDGITSAFPSAPDLYEFLQQLNPLNPQNLADKILAEALDKTGHSVTDDMTVLCTRIFENS